MGGWAKVGKLDNVVVSNNLEYQTVGNYMHT